MLDTEREAWLALSRTRLELAYADAEEDYLLDRISELNHEDESR